MKWMDRHNHGGNPSCLESPLLGRICSDWTWETTRQTCRVALVAGLGLCTGQLRMSEFEDAVSCGVVFSHGAVIGANLNLRGRV